RRSRIPSVSERLEIGELTLRYEDTGGDGPVVLLVHGLGGSVYSWWGQLAACRERGYRGIAYDQRGCGLSDKPPGPYSVYQWTQDLGRVLDALEIERAALLGHSVGSMVVEHAAVDYGDRVWALAVCGGALAWRPESGPVFEERVRLARAGRMDEIAATVATTGISERGRAENPTLDGLMRELIASNSPIPYAECSAATASATMDDLAAIRCPTL